MNPYDPSSAQSMLSSSPHGASHTDWADLTLMPLSDLAQRCRVESERFSKQKPYDSRYAYELFRRALVEREQDAWTYLYQQYAGLVEYWVRGNSAFSHNDDSSEDFVTAAFARFWRAVTPERFAQFPTVASLLHYLQRCAGCVVIDYVRSMTWADRLPETDTFLYTQVVSPDEEALERVARQELWTLLGTLLHSEAEHVVMLMSFVWGMKPAAIFAQHADLFSTVNDVYSIKRNVLARLSNNRDLRQFMS